jgi:sugar phosphate isomerase/epimerase
MMTRREALRRMSALAAGTAGLSEFACTHTNVATGPLGPLGVQLYTLRQEMARSVDETLARVAEIGYREVEFAGYFGRSPAEIRQSLDNAGLRAPAAHIDMNAMLTDWPSKLEAANTIGMQYLVVPSVPQEMSLTLDHWRAVADMFNRGAAEARDAGIRFAYHNHAREFTPIDGQIPFDVLFEQTDPDLVEIELDLFWIVHGGGDPMAVFERWPGRVPLVHVKDRTEKGVMTEVGSGAIDWEEIFGARDVAGIRHYFVEHDEPLDGFESVAASFDYLSRLGT